MAQILHCCGSGVGRQLQLRFDPWEPPYALGAALEKTKNKKPNLLRSSYPPPVFNELAAFSPEINYAQLLLA